MDFIELSKKELHHIFLVGTHLHSYQAKDSTTIPQIIQDQGMVQYDPLNPVGRYHDHFFYRELKTTSREILKK